MQVKKQQLELDMEQQTGSKSGQEYIKDIQVWPKSNPLQLYSGSDKQIQGIRSDRVPEELWTEVVPLYRRWWSRPSP